MLEHMNTEKSFFPAGYPLAGKDYFGIQNMADKTNKLSSTNTIPKKNKAARIPVDSKPGRCIKRFLLKLSPGQDRLYCQEATANQKICFANQGSPNSVFSPNKSLGAGTIRKK